MFVVRIIVAVGSGGIFGRDVSKRVVIECLTVGPTNGFQTVQFIIGIGQGFRASVIYHLADVAVVLIGVSQVQARIGGCCYDTGLQAARVGARREQPLGIGVVTQPPEVTQESARPLAR